MTQLWTGPRDLTESIAAIDQFRRRARRYSGALAGWAMVCLTAAGVFLYIASPEFIASTQILLLPSQSIAQASPHKGRGAITALRNEDVYTQLELIRSPGFLRAVFEAGPVNRAGGSFERFRRDLHVRRLGASFVIEISYRSSEQAGVAEIANAVAAAYLAAHAAKARPELRDMPPANTVSGAVSLGPATEPLAKAFPAPTPVLMVSAAFSLITGFLALVLLDQNASPKRSHSARWLSAGGGKIHLCCIAD